MLRVVAGGATHSHRNAMNRSTVWRPSREARSVPEKESRNRWELICYRVLLDTANLANNLLKTLAAIRSGLSTQCHTSPSVCCLQYMRRGSMEASSYRYNLLTPTWYLLRLYLLLSIGLDNSECQTTIAPAGFQKYFGNGCKLLFFPRTAYV